MHLFSCLGIRITYMYILLVDFNKIKIISILIIILKKSV